MTVVNMVVNGITLKLIKCRTVASAEVEYERLLKEAKDLIAVLGKGNKVYINMFDKYNKFQTSVIKT